MANIGVDKIWLHTRSFKVYNAELLNNNRLAFDPKKPEPQTAIYTDQNGEPVFGRSYYNSENWNLDINKHGLKLNFNPSGILHPYELYGVEYLSKVEEQIKDELFDRGIEIDFNSSVLTRLDLTKQAETRQPCSNYEPLFKYLSMPRYKDQQNYETGYTYGHSKASKQIVFYDKREELLNKKHIILPDVNLMRCEVRYKKKASKTTGIADYSVLKNIKTPQITFVYERELRKVLRQPNGTQLAFDFPNEKEYLLSLKKEYSKGYINKCLINQGAMSIMAKFGTRSNLANFLKSIMKDEAQAYRKAKQIEKIAITESHRTTGAYISIEDQLKELQSLFLQ